MLRRLNMLMKNIRNYIRRIRLSAWIALAAMLLTLAAGCADGSAPATQGPETSLPTVEPSPEQGGVLRLPMPENVQPASGYDPLNVHTQEMYQLFGLVYDTLLSVNSSNMLVPSLAMSWRSSGESAWILTLRSGVTWHDGGAFTADDVLYTYKRIREIGQSGYYSDVIDNVAGMMRLDDNTIRIEMRSPGLMALYCLDFPIVKENSNRVLNGTGAYRAASANDERILLEANSAWWGGTLHIAQVEFLARGSNDLAIASFEAGMLDFVPTSSLTARQYASAGETTVADCMTQKMEVMLINYSNPIMQDRDFRRAIAQLIDRMSIINNVYMGRARSSDMPFPPDSWLYDSIQMVYSYEPASAATILEEMGFTHADDGALLKNGVRVRLRILVGSTTENTVRLEAAEVIANGLRAAGIEVELINANHDAGAAAPSTPDPSAGDPEATANPYADDTEFVSLLREGDWDLALVGFSLSESNELSSYLLPGGANNFGGYDNPELTELIEEMNSAADEAALREAAYEAQAFFAQELPFITLYFRLDSVICRADIKGIGTLRGPALLRDIKNWYF